MKLSLPDVDAKCWPARKTPESPPDRKSETNPSANNKEVLKRAPLATQQEQKTPAEKRDSSRWKTCAGPKRKTQPGRPRKEPGQQASPSKPACAKTSRSHATQCQNTGASPHKPRLAQRTRRASARALAKGPPQHSQAGTPENGPQRRNEC